LGPRSWTARAVTHLPNVSMRVSSSASFINSHYTVIEPFTAHAKRGTGSLPPA
jgi:hypothetical protein